MNTPEIQDSEIPRIGQVWPNQGGVYAGIIRDGESQWHLILADTATEKFEWGNYGSEISGQFSSRNGQQNTALILTAEPNNKAAQFVSALSVDEHNDFYWPADAENQLIRINLPEYVDPSWHWSSTQYSAHSAWVTYFEGGDQYVDYKDNSYAVRAVRRLPI